MTPIEKAKEALNILENAVPKNYDPQEPFDIDDLLTCVLSRVDLAKSRISESISAIGVEKPSNDARLLAIDISLGALDRAEFWEVIVPKRIQSFAESYHAKKCAECTRNKADYKLFGVD